MAILNGTSAADTLTATPAADTMTGGIGDDTFVWVLAGGAQTDVITDFGSTYFAGPITPGQEPGNINSPAQGTFTGALHRGNLAFDWSATVTGLDFGGQTASTTDNVTASHFHAGAPGTNGGVVYGFIGVPNNETDNDTVIDAAAGTVRGQWDATEGNGTTLTAQLNNLLANNLYFNIHTSANAGGEIRGQVLKQDAGADRIDMRGTGVASFAALQPLITDVNGSAQIAVASGGQTYTLILQGVPKSALTAADFVFGADGGGGVPAGLLSAFSNIHLGRSPTATETAALTAAAALTGAAQNKAIVDTADMDTSVAVQAYQYFTGATPSQAGLAFLTNSAANPSDLNDAYYSQFNIENRYINFAANLGIQGEGAAAFQQTFGGLTFAQAVELAYGRIIGFNYAQQAGINASAAVTDIAGRIAYFQGVAKAGLPQANQDLATKAAMIGYIMAEGIKADVGAYATASNAFMTDLLDGGAQFNVNLIGVYAPLAPTGAPITGGGPVVSDPTTPVPYDPYGY